MASKWRPKPLTVERMQCNRLSESQQEALYEATGHLSPVPDDWPVRVERYRTLDIKRLVERVWKWSCRLDKLKSADDRLRVQNIIDQIEGGAPQWPYVSYFAVDMEELMQTEDDYGELSIPNHGDGWHRIIASVELTLPNFDILFVERRSEW